MKISVENPLIPGAATTFEREIPAATIIRLYRKYSIDVSRFFKGIESVKIYRCEVTGYRFYYPFSLSGDEEFYAQVEKFPWYYPEWKWEHEAIADLAKPGQSVLEIGCGQGGFLRKLKKIKNIECVGLELNKNTPHESEGVEIFHTTIEEFSKSNKETFDLVCSFQTMEHIPNAREFILAQLACLKKEGLLITSVPDNDSFFASEKDYTLNMPPHHVGLWSAASLKNLENHFEIKLIQLMREPLQPYHYKWYASIKARKYIGNYPAKALAEIAFGIFNRFSSKLLDQYAGSVHGHTIIAVYQKN